MLPTLSTIPTLPSLPSLPELRYARIKQDAQHRYKSDRVSYMEAGATDAPVILMLHGIGAHAAYFRFQLATLSDRFRVIAWNAPGYSLSDGMTDLHPSDLSYATAVSDFANALELSNFHLTGNSFGSAVAQAFAIHHPERVKTLVLTGAGVGQKTLSPEREAAFKLRLTKLKNGGYQYVDDGIDHMLGKNTPNEIKAMMMQVSRGLTIAGMESAVAFRLSSFFSPDHAAKLTMPVMLIQGSEDKTNPRQTNADLLFPLLKQAEFHEWLGIGHLPEIEDSERFNQVICDFIERCEP
jgi:pimeloyl-ACP methyl ester carboxylesterase